MPLRHGRQKEDPYPGREKSLSRTKKVRTLWKNWRRFYQFSLVEKGVSSNNFSTRCGYRISFISL